MQLTKTIQFNGSTITIKQLTVQQVRTLLEGDRNPTNDELLLEEMFPEAIPFDAVSQSSGLDAHAMLAEGVTQSDLDGMANEVVKLNPSLARVIKRRMDTLATISNLKG